MLMCMCACVVLNRVVGTSTGAFTFEHIYLDDMNPLSIPWMKNYQNKMIVNPEKTTPNHGIR